MMSGGPPYYMGVRGNGLGMPGSTTTGHAIPSPESFGVAGLGSAGLLLPGSLSSSFPPID
jgi:hypothetical protein